MLGIVGIIVALVLGLPALYYARDVILGAKIWSSGSTEGLHAELSNLTIAGEVPADQIPRADERPDPRSMS